MSIRIARLPASSRGVRGYMRAVCYPASVINGNGSEESESNKCLQKQQAYGVWLNGERLSTHFAFLEIPSKVITLNGSKHLNLVFELENRISKLN